MSSTYENDESKNSNRCDWRPPIIDFTIRIVNVRKRRIEKNRTVAIEKIEPSRSATADFSILRSDSYRKFTIRDRQRPAETRRFYDSYRKFTIRDRQKDQPIHGLLSNCGFTRTRIQACVFSSIHRLGTGLLDRQLCCHL